MSKCNTVCGPIDTEKLGIVLPHEHICCYFEYFYQMCGNEYLSKHRLEEIAVENLIWLKNAYAVDSIVDCTPVNIGRDPLLLKRVSEKSKVNIILSSGFYYTNEIMLSDISVEEISEKVIYECLNGTSGSHILPGLLKFAFEDDELSRLSQNILSALCMAQNQTGLPLCIHTNARRQNGLKILKFAEQHRISPGNITIAHCSDSDDMNYIEDIAKHGCYIGFDRI